MVLSDGDGVVGNGGEDSDRGDNGSWGDENGTDFGV